LHKTIGHQHKPIAGVIFNGINKGDDKLLVKLLKTENYPNLDLILILGWGVFARLDGSKFICFPFPGYSLAIIDIALSQHLEQFGRRQWYFSASL